MNCTNCGAEIAPGSKFCTTCGQPVMEAPVEAQPVFFEQATPVTDQGYYPEGEPVATQANPGLDFGEVKSQLGGTAKGLWAKIKPFFQNKKVLIGIAGVVALIVVLAIISAIASSGNGFITLKQTTLPVSNDDVINLIIDGKLLSDTIDSDKNYEDFETSLDGKITALLTGEDDLYIINGKKIVKVDEDVRNFQISSSGKGVAYVLNQDGDDEDEDYTLNLYNVSSKKKTTVTDDLCSPYQFTISPDGQSVVYGEKDDDETDFLYFKGSKRTKVASDAEGVLGMSNNGKYIYIVSTNDDDEDLLYCYNTKGEREKLGTIDTSYIRLNEDHTQVMFYNEDKTYIAVKGKDAEKVASDKLSLVIPNGSQTSRADYATTYPVDSLFDHVYAGDDAWLIKKNSDKNVKLVSKVSSCTLDESGEYLYYIRNEDLQVLEISKGNKAYDKAITLGEEVDNYVVTSDRKLVYFISDETLYSVNGKKGGSPRKITNDDVEYYYLSLNDKNVVYYMMDEDVYACSNGKKGTKVLSDVEGLTSVDGIAYFITEDALYVSTGSKEPKKILNLDD